MAGGTPTVGSEIEAVLDFAGRFGSVKVGELALVLDKHLEARSVMAGRGGVSIADCVIWEKLITDRSAIPLLTAKKAKAFQNLKRWWGFVSSSAQFIQATKALEAALKRKTSQNNDNIAKNNKSNNNNKSKQKNGGEKKTQGGSFDIPLPGAAEGKVVTRFPPEPSGYLHIGHAKAALLNDFFAKKFKGKCLLRFDDTNPEKEKQEFVDNIMKDLKVLGVTHTEPTTTSDYFELIKEYADKMIKEGKAYVDDTPVDKMRDERMAGIDSLSRSVSVEENMRRWGEMIAGSEYGLKCVMRAKISMQHPNKCMRDPAMYRTKLQTHHKTGDKYKVYPTYDFACPIVDSIEGVTHALRTVEYKDRDAQYNWFITALGIRRPHIWSYSRLNMRYTLLSKRKLKWFAETKRVDGWDDPRFPTVQGVIRRGLTVEALKEFILLMGASVNENLMSWDKVWAINKKKIDPIAHRFLAVSAGSSERCMLKLTNFSQPPPESVGGVSEISVQLHPKNKDIGFKKVRVGSDIWVETEDASRLKEGELITLMRWGCVVIKEITRNGDGKAVSLTGELKLTANPKMTKNKITWVCASSDMKKVGNVVSVEFDQLISKPKLEEGDDFEEFLTPVTKFETKLIGEGALCDVKEGQLLQLERRGYYRCDKNESASGGAIVLFNIPSGKAKSMSSLKTKVKTVRQ
eukprot:CAMPEP_0197522096 /NCGR_PEP_ID=MMETSP1318-20131121/7283_1 /TAXON_ID=552666 /ORGANISM="Partenskyella glossopodia, Strain RCC365" /LENGTH=686 /DNA_ID=CAMNT_0043074331 /DNA_START=114 /DNA_END=2174 /DNA_ORIENTATION=-